MFPVVSHVVDLLKDEFVLSFHYDENLSNCVIHFLDINDVKLQPVIDYLLTFDNDMGFMIGNGHSFVFYEVD